MATTKRLRSLTKAECLDFLKHKLDDLEYLGVKWGNFKKTARTSDTYQVTIDKISDEAIGRLISSELVKDVYYCASMPPGGSGYGVDLRYRLFVKFNKKEIKVRSRSTKK